MTEIIIPCGIDHLELLAITGSSANRDEDRRVFTGSTTNQVRGWENSVFSFQFSVFSFQDAVFRMQFSGCRMQDLEISSYSCDSFYSWFTIFAFLDKDVIHESNAVFYGLA